MTGSASSSTGSSTSLPPAAKITLTAAIVSPAVLAFVALRVVQLTAPLGRALRGDSPLESGVLTVIVLVVAAVLVAKSIAGTKERTLFVATGGALLFGVVMIIVTFGAGEAPDLGEGPSIGIAPYVAPLAALVGVFAAGARARKVWTSRYDARERIVYAGLASLMLLLSLELGPFGAARSAPVKAHPSSSTTAP